MIPPSFVDQILFESHHRIVISFPRVHFIYGPISRAVVGCTVMTKTICHGFNQHRSRLFHGNLSSCLGSIVYSKQIVSIYSDCYYAVSWTSSSYSIASILKNIVFNNGNYNNLGQLVYT